MKVTAILRAKSTTDFGCLTRGVYYTPAFTERFMNDANAEDSQIINNETAGQNDEILEAFPFAVLYPKAYLKPDSVLPEPVGMLN